MNQFDSKGGGQSIAQGDHSIGQQNNSGCVKQTSAGDGCIIAGTGDVRIGHLHQHYSRTEHGIPLQRPPKAEHFTGRDAALKELLDALQPGRAVTLCGPGGMGKTALAAQAVWTLAPGKEAPALFPDGIIFHSFYGQEDVSLAFAHIVRSYDEEQQDTSFAAAFRLMASKQALLILDGAEEASDLPAVLRLRGGCGVLITSRKKEDAPVAPLAVTPLGPQDAEELFRRHSGSAADAETTAAICALLGGWPVALRIAGRYCSTTGESAAAYLRFLRQQPFRRLGKGEHGQENAALLLRRSVAQVSDDARLALALAGCLAFAPLAPEPVAAILDSDELRSADALGELVNYGLLERKAERWQTSHALIHTYARTELVMSKESMAQLAKYYIVFCRAASDEGVKGYTRLDGERAHCLRLIESCLASELWQEVKLLVWAIDIYLERQGYWTEELAALEMRLKAARQAGDRREEGVCLGNLGYTCDSRGEREEALRWYEQSLPICRELGERKEEGALLNNIAAIYRQQGKHELALQYFQQSLSIGREIGDREGEGTTLNNIGRLYRAQGDNETALQHYEQAMSIRREAGDKIGVGQTLNNIGSIYYAQSDYAKALEHFEQALAICQQLGDRAGEAVTRWIIGLTYYDLGDLAKAEEYISRAVQLAEQMSHPSLEEYRDGLKQVRAARRG
ncbi:MAG: tetratricopeptide repeat protein [Candidatus Electronema sp. V4]|uniref:tetratricopeptide repeat protein n=1 Tax=Candidatus Electronema sp. V4 TaxID=3454756 RepID=UPI0040555140